QDEPLQLEPLQDEPLHELPDQDDPLHELPVQTEPFQIPPDQLEPVASSAAIAAEMNGLPKMSCSPWRATGPIEMWSVPRDASREPVPVEGGLYCCDAATDGTAGPKTLLLSSRPHPPCFQLTEGRLSHFSIRFPW